MKKLQEYLIELGYWLATIYLLACSGVYFAISFGAIRLEDIKKYLTPFWWDILIYLLASISFVLGLYFLVRLGQARRWRRRIEKAGKRGQILISPWAIKDFIEEVLSGEVGLPKFKVSLTQCPEGIDIKVQATLAMEHNIVETGEKIQELLAERVEKRIGVHVNKVEVVAFSIGISQTQRRRTISISKEKPLTTTIELKESAKDE